MGLLERLLKAADEGGRMGSVIEILILQALAHQMQEDIPAALTSLERALKLAEPEGYMRIFLAEGSSMAELIRKLMRAEFCRTIHASCYRHLRWSDKAWMKKRLLPLPQLHRP